MAGLGFKDFQVGEVLTSADVDGYLMQQSVMRFADSAARGSALGTATGTGVPLAEGMVSYLDDTNSVEVYTGAAWLAVGGFNARTAITATDASWTVPTLAHPVVRVTVVGGGGGGGGSGDGTSGGSGSAGGSSAFGSGAAYEVSASGGRLGQGAWRNDAAPSSLDGLLSGNGGQNGTVNYDTSHQDGSPGSGGAVTVAYVDLTGITTVNVVVGAGGAGGTKGGTNGFNGAAGGDGVVIVEYRAG